MEIFRQTVELVGFLEILEATEALEVAQGRVVIPIEAREEQEEVMGPTGILLLVILLYLGEPDN